MPVPQKARALTPPWRKSKVSASFLFTLLPSAPTLVLKGLSQQIKISRVVYASAGKTLYTPDVAFHPWSRGTLSRTCQSPRIDANKRGEIEYPRRGSGDLTAGFDSSSHIRAHSGSAGVLLNRSGYENICIRRVLAREGQNISSVDHVTKRPGVFQAQPPP